MGERIIAVVGARLNSSRLPKKHFLPLAGKPIIERIWQRLNKIDRLTEIVLATTSDDYNMPLRDWAEQSGRRFLAYDGDINDLMGRVDFVVKRYNADILLYVCGDCPLIEPAAIDRMLDCLIEQRDIDTVLFDQSRGKVIHEGFDVYRRGFWDKMVAASREPFEKEHIGAVFHHRKKVTPNSVATIPEPDEYCGLDHRISVDTASDYRFMKNVYLGWYSENSESSIVDLGDVISRLQEEPDLRRLNQHVYQKTINDVPVKATVVTEASAQVGMGHLTRALVAVAALQDYMGASVKLVIKGDPIDLPELQLVSHVWLEEWPKSFWAEMIAENDLIVFDVKEVPQQLLSERDNRNQTCFLLGIDVSPDTASVCDLAWYPSFFAALSEGLVSDYNVGWDCFLLKDGPTWKSRNNTKEKRVLVLSGGSDAAGLGQTLPDTMLKLLPEKISIDWVQGPYAAKPVVSPDRHEKRLRVLFAPDDLQNRLINYDAVVCVYGVSYFECLRSGVPTVVFDPNGAARAEEWRELMEIFPDRAAKDQKQAVAKLIKVLGDEGCGTRENRISQQLRQGPRYFASEVTRHLSAKKN